MRPKRNDEGSTYIRQMTGQRFLYLAAGKFDYHYSTRVLQPQHLKLKNWAFSFKKGNNKLKIVPSKDVIILLKGLYLGRNHHIESVSFRYKYKDEPEEYFLSNVEGLEGNLVFDFVDNLILKDDGHNFVELIIKAKKQHKTMFKIDGDIAYQSENDKKNKAERDERYERERRGRELQESLAYSEQSKKKKRWWV